MRPLVWFASQIHLSLGVDWYTKPLTSVRGLSLYLCVPRYVRPLGCFRPSRRFRRRLCQSWHFTPRVAKTDPMERTNSSVFADVMPVDQPGVLLALYYGLSFACMLMLILQWWVRDRTHGEIPIVALENLKVDHRKPNSYIECIVLANKCRKKNDAVM